MNSADILNNPLLLLEVVTILSVFGIQILFFLRAKKEIQILANIFKEKIRVYKEDWIDDTSNNKATIEHSVVQLKSSSENYINQRIKNAINDYLKNNYGATVNYSIIKDIVDREIDSKDEEISNLIPIPLYLGLAATIVGIIFGLFSMPSLAVNEAANLGGIDQLMNGVKIAMFASLSGLVWTITLSSYLYNNARQEILEDKNEQLNYLQEQLLPELFNEEDSEIRLLKNSVDNFSRQSKGIVEQMNEVADKLKSNISLQHETSKKLDNLNITQLSKVNVELFGKLESNMAAFEKFSEYIDQLGQISQNLRAFSDRAGSIEHIAQKVETNLEESKQLTRFLTEHFEEMEQMRDVTLTSFDLSEKRFNEAVDKLSETTAEKINSVRNISDDIEKNFNDVYSQLFQKLEDIARLHIEEFSTVYEESLPKFQNLDHLEELEKIQKQLTYAFNGAQVKTSNGETSVNNITQANQHLSRIAELLEQLEENSRNVGQYTSRPNIVVRMWRKIKEFFARLF